MKYGGIRVTLGKVLPDYGAWQARPMTARLIREPAVLAPPSARDFWHKVMAYSGPRYLSRSATWTRPIGRGTSGRPSPPLRLYGDRGAGKLLIASQIVLSLQLPFELVALIRLVADPTQMGRHLNAMVAMCRPRSWLK